VTTDYSPQERVFIDEVHAIIVAKNAALARAAAAEAEVAVLRQALAELCDASDHMARRLHEAYGLCCERDGMGDVMRLITNGPLVAAVMAAREIVKERTL
jgi:hypothetical protein